jgi:hypothetical protein
MNKRRKEAIRWFAILSLVWMAYSSHGQLSNYGIFAGVTASQVDGDSYSGFNKLGLNAGGFMNQLIDLNIYWQAELKYVTKGVYKGPGDYDPTLYRSTYHVIELPLSAHYLFDDKLQVELGIAPEVLLKVVFRDENGIMSPSNFPDNRRFGFSVFAGLSYWFSPSTGVNLRYTNSAIPFREPQEWNNPQYKGYFHNVISLSLAFRIKHS